MSASEARSRLALVVSPETEAEVERRAVPTHFGGGSPRSALLARVLRNTVRPFISVWSRAPLLPWPYFVVDYAELVDLATFSPVTDDFAGPAVVALAVRVGTTRLIDNLQLDLHQV